MTKTSNSDYVPRKDTEFKEWSDPLMVYLKSKLTDFGIPEDRYGELSVAHGNFTTAYAVAITPETRTPAAIRKKTEMREAFESMLRKFIAEFITNNSKVTDWDRENMHVPIH
ncbi:MAG: hypothetical protein LBP64_08285, partial [Tannerella sp.]|nr:hypothetical protein [Tannerella sp.]